MAGLVIAKVIREHIPIDLTTNGTQSIGQKIDEHLENAARCGDEIQTVAVEFDETSWRIYQDTIRSDRVFANSVAQSRMVKAK